jgi:septal ring factor EnvC (AmiA/AmiB activator)
LKAQKENEMSEKKQDKLEAAISERKNLNAEIAEKTTAVDAASKAKAKAEKALKKLNAKIAKMLGVGAAKEDKPKSAKRKKPQLKTKIIEAIAGAGASGISTAQIVTETGAEESKVKTTLGKLAAKGKITKAKTADAYFVAAE